ncbi:unnamed protein product, partial [Mycena citricolor]
VTSYAERSLRVAMLYSCRTRSKVRPSALWNIFHLNRILSTRIGTSSLDIASTGANFVHPSQPHSGVARSHIRTAWLLVTCNTPITSELNLATARGRGEREKRFCGKVTGRKSSNLLSSMR